MERKDVLNKEIDLIQNCIKRMAQNSFMIKGWTISLVAVVLALLPEKFDNRPLGFIGVAATLCFWYLDAFFLCTEKLYRAKYNWVIHNRLKSDEFMFDLNPNNRSEWERPANARQWPPSVWSVMWSKTLWPPYLLLMLLSAAYIIYTFAA